MPKYLPLALMVAGFLSCKKSENNNNNCVLNATTIAGTYQIIAITYQSSPGAPATDQFSNLPGCEKDDNIVLDADGSLSFVDAGINCGIPPEPGSASSWTLENNNTILKFGDQQFSIKSFDCKQLVIVESNAVINGDSRTTTIEKQQ